MTSLEIEIALADWLGVGSNGKGKSSQYMIVPNFKGLSLAHECDLLVVTGSAWAWEIEIKVSKSDLKRDAAKMMHHESNLILRLYFAMPDTMRDRADLVPERAGILYVTADGECYQHRAPKLNMDARKLTPEEIITVGRLASLRIWGLKRKLREAL